MTFRRAFSWTGLVLLAACAAEPHAGETSPEGAAKALTDPLGAQELAILIPMDVDDPIDADTRGEAGPLMPHAWLGAVEDALETTPVADALAQENYRQDWRVVSLRLSPCAPLGVATTDDIDTLCWPQVRLVWQPVIPDFDLGWRRFDNYADDRAIHVIHDWRAPGLTDARSIRDALARRDPIDAATRARFVEARDAAVDAFVDAVRGLRGAGYGPEDYGQIGIRAELWGSYLDAYRFREDLVSFLGAHTGPDNLAELTAFSLPEGRVPALQDQWVFVQFLPEAGRLVQQDLTVRDPADGSVLATMRGFQVVDTASEDPGLVAAAQDPVRGARLRERVVFEPADATRLGETIADPSETLVPNTSCASCHRLNDIRFDLHNLSHLEERPHTVSPRVRADVARDQQWLAAHVD